MASSEAPKPTLSEMEVATKDKTTGVAEATKTSTTAATTFAACHAVLNTTELLEAILLYLPSINVFGVRRVSKKWHDVLLESTSIQKATFLTAVPETAPWIPRATVDLSAGPFDPRRSDYELVMAPAGDCHGIHYVGDVPKEYCLLPQVPTKMCPLIVFRPTDEGYESKRHHATGWEPWVLKVKGFMAQPGSWSEMLLTNPPCKSIALRAVVEFDTDPAEKVTASIEAISQAFTVGGMIEEAMSIEPRNMKILRDGATDGDNVEQPKSINDFLAELQKASSTPIGFKSRKIFLWFRQMDFYTEEEEEKMARDGRVELLK